MSEQDGKIVNLGGLKKFKEYYDTDIITPINNKIDSKTNVQSGEIITTNNDTIGYFKNIKINGNTRYKKSDGTYTDTWESGVSLESMGEKEKNSNGKYPIIIKSSNDTKEDKRTVLLDSPLRKNDVLDLEKLKITRNYGSATFNGSDSENWVEPVEDDYGTIRFKYDINYIGKSTVIGTNNISMSNLQLITRNDIEAPTDAKEGIIHVYWNGDTIGHLYIKLLKSKLETQDVAGFKKWLQSNPVTVVYQLATPTTEDIQISPTDNPLTSYTPSTTLTTNNTIKGNISADIPTNLSGVITQQASLIAQLEDNLLQTQALLIDNVIDNT